MAIFEVFRLFKTNYARGDRELAFTTERENQTSREGEN